MRGSRRSGVVLLLVLSVVTAGCLGVVLGTEPLRFVANDATVDPDALEQTGYREYRDTSINQTRTFSVVGQNRTVEISNELHAYNRTGPLGPVGRTEVGRLVVFSTPAAAVAGRTLNPISRLSSRAIVRRFLGPASGGGSLTFVGNRTVRVLGSGRTVSTFETVRQTEGRQVNVTVHVTVFEHGSDFVAVVAVHPQQVGNEQARIDRLLRSLRHRTDG